MNSSRTGCASPAGKMSTMPPRMANSPCSSAGSSREKPASTSSSARSVGAMSCPGLSSSDALSSRSGELTRGSSAAAEATTTRAVPLRDRVTAPARAPTSRRSAAPGRDTDRLRATETAGPRDRPPTDDSLRARPGRSRRRAALPRGRRRSARRTGRRRAAAPARRRRRTAPSPTGSARDRARGRIHAAARDGGFQNGAKVQRSRGGHENIRSLNFPVYQAEARRRLTSVPGSVR